MDRLTIFTFLGMCLVLLRPNVDAKEPSSIEGSSSMDARQQAIRQIPFRLLNDQAKQKLGPVLDDPSLFRRMPSQSIDSDPEMFTFVVRHPEILVNIWDLMGITKVTVDRLTPYIFKGQDGAGTECNAELIYGSDELHIYYGTGSYDGAMVGRELKGRCVCVLHNVNQQKATGGSSVAGQMDVFLKLDSVGADLVVKTIGPFVGKTADSNFVESAKFVSQLSQAAERNPTAVQQLASRMDKVQPAVRDQFMQVTANVAKRNIRYSKSAVATGGDDGNGGVPAEDVLQAWREQSRVAPADLHLKPTEKSEPQLRR